MEPTWVKVLYAVIYVLIYLGVISLAAGFVTLIERRVAGRIQSRIGPNRVGPQGVLQWLADGLKAIQKEDIMSKDLDRTLFRIAPYFVFAGMFATWAAIPISAMWVMTELDVGIFYVIAISSLVVVGLVMGGWASNNKWSLLGGMRSAAQLISYEIPTAIAVFMVILAAGSMNLQDIINAQGANPKDWFIFRNPFLFVAFFIFFIAALAEGNRTPFDIPEAESELVSGYNTEYSGMRFVFFFFAEYANLFVIGALVTVMFFGGWKFWWELPITISLPFTDRTITFDLLQPIWFFIKMNIFVFIIIWLRWTLPRLRVDQLMNLCWKYLVPIGFVMGIGLMFWLYFVREGSVVDNITRIILSLFGLFIVLLFFYKVYRNLRYVKAKLHFNPFI